MYGGPTPRERWCLIVKGLSPQRAASCSVVRLASVSKGITLLDHGRQRRFALQCQLQ